VLRREALEIYRLGHRIDIVLVEGSAERRECGMPSDHAYDELEATLAALDSHEHYGYDPEPVECIELPGARIPEIRVLHHPPRRLLLGRPLHGPQHHATRLLPRRSTP